MKKMKKIILGKGILGTAFGRIFPDAKIFSREDLDISSEANLKNMIKREKPNLIINCAAFTKVDDAEDEKELSRKTNADAVKYLAKLSKLHSIKLMHFSTDYIFDGENKKGYKESYSNFNPLNYYGKTKLEGEKNLKKYGENFWLIRTSAVFGSGGKNFVSSVEKVGKEKKELKIVADQFFSPTFSDDLARKCKKIIEEEISFGIYHITNSGSCSWHELAKEIFKIKKINCKVSKISSEDFGAKAKRPKNSILINTKLSPLRSWEEALNDFLLEKS